MFTIARQYGQAKLRRRQENERVIEHFLALLGLEIPRSRQRAGDEAGIGPYLGVWRQ